MLEEYYGFDSRPFQLTPDPAFYFESNSHRKALSYLSYGLSQAEGFIVITGEVGAGKSILMAHLRQQLDAQNVTVGQIVTSLLDGEELLVLVARAFGLGEVKNKPRALAAIEQFLVRTGMDGGRTLLIVDEAQNLSRDALEELRMLSNFQIGGRPLLQTILLGQPEFRDTLRSAGSLEQLRQRVIASHHLEGMEPQEVEPYVLHRLTRAGWHGRPTLDPRLWERLHHATGGLPRKINQVMTRLLLLGTVERADRLDETMLGSVLAEMAMDAGAVDNGADKLEPAATTHEGVAACGYATGAEKAGGGMPPSQTAGDIAAEPAERAFATATPAEQSGPVSSILSTDHLEAIESAFAERDRHLTALREQIERVTHARQHDTEAPETLVHRVSEIELRLDEQERSLRHVLQMMIEYFENAGPAT